MELLELRISGWIWGKEPGMGGKIGENSRFLRKKSEIWGKFSFCRENSEFLSILDGKFPVLRRKVWKWEKLSREKLVGKLGFFFKEESLGLGKVLEEKILIF